MTHMYDVTLPTPEQPFTHFELDLTPAEQACLARFEIHQMGDLSDTLEALENSLDRLKAFIGALGENNPHDCATMVQLVMKLAHQALSLFQQECAYIILRAFIPNNAFATPRWHQDGYYHHPYAGKPFKAAIPLKGAGTLFYHPNAEELETFKQMEDRSQIAALLGDPAKTTSTPSGYGSVFIVGGEAGTIHSEPNICSQRFFMSVLPGRRQDIQSYDEKQKTVDQMQKAKKPMQEIVQFLEQHLAAEMATRNPTA